MRCNYRPQPRSILSIFIALVIPGCSNESPSSNSPVQQIAPISANGHDPKSVDSSEQRVQDIYTNFLSQLEPCRESLSANPKSDQTESVLKPLATVQEAFDQLQQLASENPDSAIVQETFAEAAVQFASLQQTNLKWRVGRLASQAGIKLTQSSKLKEMAMKAFEVAVAIDPTLAKSHDYIAKLRLEQTRKLTDPTILQHLLDSVKNDPGNSRSIQQLVKILIETDALSDAQKSSEISSVLRHVHGEARRELQIASPGVQEELRKARLELEQHKEDSKAASKAAIESLDVRIAQLNGIRRRFATPGTSRGPFGEVNRQAEAAGKSAARGLIDEDLDSLIKQRKMMLEAAEKSDAARKKTKEQKVDRLERATALLQTTIDNTRE